MQPFKPVRSSGWGLFLRIGKRTVVVAIGIATSAAVIAALQHPNTAVWVSRQGWVGVLAALLLVVAALAPWGAMLASRMNNLAGEQAGR